MSLSQLIFHKSSRKNLAIDLDQSSGLHLINLNDEPSTEPQNKTMTIKWPEPELSIGEDWCLMKGLLKDRQCWEAIGPAKNAMDELINGIKNELEQQQEYLRKGICTPHRMMFTMYMIGHTRTDANPVIVFSCRNKLQRKRALKVIRKSCLLDPYPGITLGDSSRPPILTGPVIPLSSYGSKSDFELPSINIESADTRIPVYYSAHSGSSYGISVFVRQDSHDLHQATVGGFICMEGRIFGLTVAHILDKDQEESTSVDNDVELSIDEEDDEKKDDEDIGDITSQGNENRNPISNVTYVSDL